jgi:hypothetical protein
LGQHLVLHHILWGFCTIYDVRRDVVVPKPLLLYSQLAGSTNNLMMARLQGRNMLYITLCCILHSDTI